MARDCVRRRFRGALIGTYKHLILGANSAVSDFRCWLLHACTGSRYKFLQTRRAGREGINADARIMLQRRAGGPNRSRVI